MRTSRSLRERLATEAALVGLLQTHPDPTLSEMAGLCGYGFLMLDGEHGLFSETDFVQAMRSATAGDVAALVRVRSHDTQPIGRYLDFGADGIIVPNVTTADQARALACAMTYPPAGTRGFGAAAHRGTGFGAESARHLEDPLAGKSLLVIIESAAGVANADEILSVDGVDGVIIGPSDLSINLGAWGDFSSTTYVEAFARVERAALKYGKLMGTAPHGANMIEALVKRGHKLFIIGSDTGLVREALGGRLASARATAQAVVPSTL